MRVFLLWCATSVGIGDATVLDWPTVARLARQEGPGVRVSTARRAEVEALRQNADVPAGGNPELALTVGPGFVNPGTTPALEFLALLTWSFDLSGSAGARQRWADQRRVEADLDVDDAARLAVGEALDLWALACGATERADIARARTALDAELVRIAEVRRAAGAVGDGDLALARVLQAGGAAQLQSAQGERLAYLAQLAARLSLAADIPLDVRDQERPAPATLSELLTALVHRPDLERVRAARTSAELDHTVQQRTGWVVPRVTIGGGRGPEYQGELGLTVPLPVYQRNQANAAVAGARVETAGVEMALTMRQAAAELHAAHARFVATQSAYALLQGARAAMDDAEHLALRGFELGQDTLAATVVARRETVNARVALQEAKVAMLRAQVALCVAAGTCATQGVQ